MSSSVHRVSVREMNETRYHRQRAVMARMLKQWQDLAQRYSVSEARVNQLMDTFRTLNKTQAELDSCSSRDIGVLNNRITSFIDTLRDETSREREAQLEKQALHRRTQAHRQHNITALATLLKNQSIVDPILVSKLENADLSTNTQLNATIFQALAVVEKQAVQLTAPQIQLLAQLKAQSEGVVQFWQSGQPSSPFAMQCEQITLMIEKLVLVNLESEAEQARQQLNDIRLIEDDSRAHLRADSLIMMIAEQLKMAKQRIELIDLIEQRCDELAVFSTVRAVEVGKQLTALSKLGSVIQLTQFADQLAIDIEQAEQEVIAVAQRKTVLDGLSKLGYQVQESAVKSWEIDGKVIISHPTTPGYGLELGGKQNRFQARTVALSQHRDMSRDLDVDAIWCNQHQQLQALIAQQDAELMIERALPAGSGQMKVYEIEDASEHAMKQKQPASVKSNRVKNNRVKNN